jgi:hypothetical protein
MTRNWNWSRDVDVEEALIGWVSGCFFPVETCLCRSAAVICTIFALLRRK